MIYSNVIYDGIRKAVVQLSCTVEQGDFELFTKKVDVGSLQYKPTMVSIEEIEYNINGGLVRLYWEANENVPIIDLTGWGEFCYDNIGEMPNPLPPGFTGNILLSTIGFDLGSSYSIKLDLKKKKNRSVAA